ncbi:hypothetical protein Taro_045816 [Colocasia esculenta]|uniref:Uncharacterized protein n=1 Tax=Colocasia esculenta TaxID=4460 RepID=A0A843WXX7_COLES|nr:hypothetical protein [Colocasia esculenta]
MNDHIIKKAIRIIFMSRQTLVRFATGREQNATLGCEQRDGDVRSGSKIATGCSSHSECDRFAVVIRPQNAAYRAVVFVGSAPESDREKTCSWIAVQNCLILT